MESPCWMKPEVLLDARTPPAVFVVDDDVTVREALDLIVRRAGWNAVTFECAAEFLAYERPKLPSCLILDVRLPDLNGLEVQRRIATDGDCLPIVFISGYSDIGLTVRAMKAGAVGFLTKPLGDECLLSTIEEAIGRSRIALAKETEARVLRSRYGSLSRREREVMDLVVSGCRNRQVALHLGISEITVKAHRGRVMRKMGAASLADLVGMHARLCIESWPKTRPSGEAPPRGGPPVARGAPR